MNESLLSAKKILQAHNSKTGLKPSLVNRSPGRVEVMGRHLDYMVEKVVTFSTEQAIWLSFAPNNSGRITAYSEQWGPTSCISITLDKIRSDSFNLRGYTSKEKMIYAILRIFFEDYNVIPSGGDIYIDSDIPTAAGVSSSAAYGCALVELCNQIMLNGKLSRMTVAKIEQKAEHLCGSNVGLLDQIGCLEGREGHVIRFDPHTGEIKLIPWPKDIGAAVLFTGCPRKLGETCYGDRRIESENALHITRKYLGQDDLLLRNITDDNAVMLNPDLTPMHIRRYRHLRSEILRVSSFWKWLKDDYYRTEGECDRDKFANMVFASHLSITNDYEVGHISNSIAVQAASKIDKNLGAALMGAGCGGSNVGFFKKNEEDSLEQKAAEWLSSYCEHIGSVERIPIQEPLVLVTSPSNGLETFHV